MKIQFPSREFDDVVASVCHGSFSEDEAKALNELLRVDPNARDEYIKRLELHSRMATTPELVSEGDADFETGCLLDRDISRPAPHMGPRRTSRAGRLHHRRIAGALAVCIALVAVGLWNRRQRVADPMGGSSHFVAMLEKSIDAEWVRDSEVDNDYRPGAPLEPGWLRLESGLVEVVTYNGARVAILGPAELDLISAAELYLGAGNMVAEVPPQARGFLVRTDSASLRDQGAFFGLQVDNERTEAHVFEGMVELVPAGSADLHDVRAGACVVIDKSTPPLETSASLDAFEALFDLRDKSEAADVRRYQQSRESSAQLKEDPSLLAHLDPRNGSPGDWRLRIAGNWNTEIPDATIIGCEWTSGRWPNQRALEFQSVNDRVRLSAPGVHDSLTLGAWVRIKGLDRRINSIFMSDGFAPGTIHWSIRDDGALGLTVIGRGPGAYQLVVSSPVIRLDQFGMWIHLAVVVDGAEGRVTHYVNGRPVEEKGLRISPPFHIGPAEIGNWNAVGFPGNDPFLIRNFSGSMDEFLIFSRPLKDNEIHGLYVKGRPSAPVSSNGAKRFSK